MTKLICFLVTLTMAITVQAQQAEPVLGYTQDIKFNGKTYEHYQTPQGDNVLIGKEEAKRNGVFLFKAAKKLLTAEPMFSLAIPMVNLGATTLNADKVLRTDASARNRDNSFASNSSYQLEGSNGGFTVVGGLSFRPPSYRHLQIAGLYDMASSGIIFSAEHDFLVIPSGESFSAFSAGYFYGKAELQKVYRLKGTSTGEGIEVPFTEQGLTVSYRLAVAEITDGTRGSLVVNYKLGKHGTQQFFGGMQFAFGGGKK